MLIGQQIAVVGAGIGGLAVALALAQRGAQVHVFEQAPEIREVGAGIQISPNGARVLEALGVQVPGLRSEAVHLRDGLLGGRLLRMRLPDTGAGFWLCHRADVIAALKEAAEIAGVTITLGAEVTEVAQGRLTFREHAPVDVSLIIGADGLHSRVRWAILGQTTPHFTGQVAWRAIVQGEKHPLEAQVHVGPGAHVVSYPLRKGEITNIVAVEERQDWTDEGWSHQGDPHALRARFAGFAPDVTNLLEQVDLVHVWGLFRHEIAPRWFKGGLVLLGDAAHPTLPFLAQGAVMALEDAWVLAACLADHDLPEALALYQTRRSPRVHRAISAANDNARNYHLRGPKRWAAHKALKVIDRLAPQHMLARYAWLYDADVTV